MTADRSVFAPSPFGVLVPIYREGGALGGNNYEDRSESGNPELANPWGERRKTSESFKFKVSSSKSLECENYRFGG